MATCAEILGAKLPDAAGEDSVSLLSLLSGSDQPTHEDLVVHSYSADILSVRNGPWKLSLCAGDGVNRPWCSEKGAPHDLADAEAIKQGRPPIQLYNVEEDPGETRNVQAEHPEIVADLVRRVSRAISRGRSTPGSPQKNDAVISVSLPGGN